MIKNTNTPIIRFKGFSDNWEWRECKKILKPNKSAIKIGPFGSALKKEFYTKKGVKVYAQENIFKEDFSIGDYYISNEKYQSLKGCELKSGDLVISMMGTIGACAIFPDDAEPGIMNSHLLRLQLSDDIFPEYIHQLLKDSQLIRNQIDRLSVGSIMSGLSSSVVQKLIFPVPPLAEQKIISKFLLQMDNLITLYQHKYEKLKKIKESMIKKMFPVNGEKIPKIRFKEFTGAWEQRKLGDLGDFKNGMNFSKDAMGKGYPFVNLQNIFGRNVIDVNNLGLAEASATQLKEYNLKKGDVLFVRSSVKLEGVGEAALVPQDLDNTTYSGLL